jgi:thiol-disulfide isomerase/thioredoxin
MRMVLLGTMVLMIFSFSCAEKKKATGEVMVGKLTMESVYKKCPHFLEAAREFNLDEGLVQQLKDVNRDITIMVFLGTWCSDSEEHVPPFHELVKAAENPRLRVEYFGVDRQKNDGLGLARRFDIQYVPTFIVLEGEKEIGRIVEKPKISIGQDLLNILRGQQ